MISDEVFREALDVALKGQGFKIKERESLIKGYLMEKVENRNAILDFEERFARQHQAAKKASKRSPSEFEEQCAFVHWFKKTYPGTVIMSIRNGGSRTPRERVDQMREGLHPGAADLYVPEWHLWIEFKRVKGGVLSDEQKEFNIYVTYTCRDTWMLAEGCEDGKKKVLTFFNQTQNKTLQK
jgi:hypothetical protein